DASIVFLTAHSDRQTLDRAKKVQPHGYLLKPFDKGDLDSTIQVALAKAAADKTLKESRDDLLAILDAQRQGTLILTETGQVNLISLPGREILQVAESDALGYPWRDVLSLSEEAVAELAANIERPQARRSRVAAQRQTSGGEIQSLEIEVQDDPRATGQLFLYVYDVSDVHNLRDLLDASARFDKLVGKSPQMQQVYHLISDLAKVDSTVVIQGETGTGKELVARAIHKRSDRKDKPFVALNCAGLSEDLANSQLFGHRRGAFTGAVDDQIGMFEAAEGGTLFLDEIGDVSVSVQTNLLRALEQREVLRIGETQPRIVDVRIIAATNCDLAEEVDSGRFRQDLYYRLRVAMIRLPPLRERREDICLLINRFLAEHHAALGKRAKSVSREALSVLLDYPWPGNVRELKNALEFGVLRAEHETVELENLPEEIRSHAESIEPSDTPEDEREKILDALAKTGGNRKEAAKLLGISRATLYRRLDDLNIDLT
ncbi:MAG: sigma 54-interacting transcriptional regulator, partial [Pirellulales bacterium]|nr:sigma 54-interacting transcriptional regulator [Pirellulales bacterium]